MSLIDQNDTQELLKSLGLLLQELQIHSFWSQLVYAVTSLQAVESTYLTSMTTTTFPRMLCQAQKLQASKSKNGETAEI